jgi:hypothetical protein
MTRTYEDLRQVAVEAVELKVADEKVPHAPKACPTYQTTSGDHTICNWCGESWRTGNAPACVQARRILVRAIAQEVVHGRI